MSNRRLWNWAMCGVGVCFLWAMTGRAAESKGAIKKRLADRSAMLVELKTKGTLGEVHTGYVDAVKAASLKKADVAAMVKGENADRKALYEILAKEQGATVGTVARHGAMVKFEKASAKEYFKTRDGEWRTKQAILDAAK